MDTDVTYDLETIHYEDEFIEVDPSSLEDRPAYQMKDVITILSTQGDTVDYEIVGILEDPETGQVYNVGAETNDTHSTVLIFDKAGNVEQDRNKAERVLQIYWNFIDKVA